MATRKSKKKAFKKVVKKVKKQVKRKTKPKKKKAPPVIGVVTHYFPHVKAAVVKLKRPLRINDDVTFLGHTTNFSQKVTSMQINHKPIEVAKKGDEIGLEVNDRVREHDLVLPTQEAAESKLERRPASG